MTEISIGIRDNLSSLDRLASDLLLEDADQPVAKVAYEVPEENVQDILGMKVMELLWDYCDPDGQEYLQGDPNQILFVVDKMEYSDGSVVNRYELRLEYGPDNEEKTSLRLQLKADRAEITSYVFDRRDQLDVSYGGHDARAYLVTEQQMRDLVTVFKLYSNEENQITPPPLY